MEVGQRSDGRMVDGHVAVTGEVSKGIVKPVGGVPSKVEAAEHAGLTTVLIPSENQLERFEHTTIQVVPIARLEEALERMLLPLQAALPEKEPTLPQPVGTSILQRKGGSRSCLRSHSDRQQSHITGAL